MKQKLFIDIETYSSVDLIATNVSKYVSSPDFEILLAAYSIDGQPVQCMDLISNPHLKGELKKMITCSNVIKIAHNSIFEATCFGKYFGIPFYPREWQCTMTMAHLLNLPGALGKLSDFLKLGNLGKKDGKDLISYFGKPCKQTIVNGGRTRNRPEHNPGKWELFKKYCIGDVEAEMAVYNRLKFIWDELSEEEKEVWYLDQIINYTGIKVDTKLIKNACMVDELFKIQVKDNLKGLTCLENPNSLVQLKKWIRIQDPELQFESLDKENIGQVLENTKSPAVKQAIGFRKLLSKSSNAKYIFAKEANVNGYLYNTMLYGKAITGRWAGAGLQVHNLPKNKLGGNYDDVRNKYLNLDITSYNFDDPRIPFELSQLIRTIIIPEDNRLLLVEDYSSIEARILAWLAGERWVLDVFMEGGDIYKATASKMFNVPIEEVTPEQRQKGKVAVLACGYRGRRAAIQSIMKDWPDELCIETADRWRALNPKIVRFWTTIGNMAEQTIKFKSRLRYPIPGETDVNAVIKTFMERGCLVIQLPSGRKIYYPRAEFGFHEETGRERIFYEGTHPKTHKWCKLETYDGKLVENITQAIARDILALAMLRLYNSKKYLPSVDIRMHVHDEIVLELDDIYGFSTQKKIEEIMCRNLDWCRSLPLAAEGFFTKYYMKEEHD
jgi:DNA polymerase